MTQETSLALVIGAVAEIFEREESSLGAETRLLRDLPCESIDLLEIAARLSRHAGREIDDDALFLRVLRATVAEHAAEEPSAVIRRHFPWLSEERVGQILSDMKRLEPFVTLGDMAAYLDTVRG